MLRHAIFERKKIHDLRGRRADASQRIDEPGIAALQLGVVFDFRQIHFFHGELLRSLKQYFQAELNETRRTRFEDSSKARRSQVTNRQREVGAIRQVENFGAELNPRPLIDGEILEQGSVEVRIAGAADD